MLTSTIIRKCIHINYDMGGQVVKPLASHRCGLGSSAALCTRGYVSRIYSKHSSDPFFTPPLTIKANYYQLLHCCIVLTYQEMVLYIPQPKLDHHLLKKHWYIPGI